MTEKINSDDVTIILRVMLKRLEAMEDRINTISASCNKMDTHISFIEQVYNKLSAPLDFLMYNIISPIMNTTMIGSGGLPVIKH
jgi:hypothetical protein